MKLDDRPVIEQLLNPTPPNIVHEVEAHMDTLIDGSEYALVTVFDVALAESFGWLRAFLDDDAKERLTDTLHTLAADLADAECSRRQALMELMTRELEARL